LGQTLRFAQGDNPALFWQRGLGFDGRTVDG